MDGEIEHKMDELARALAEYSRVGVVETGEPENAHSENDGVKDSQSRQVQRGGALPKGGKYKNDEGNDIPRYSNGHHDR